MALDISVDRLIEVSANRFLVANEMTNNPVTVSGIRKLAQSFEKLLLQTPGSDIFAPSLGGGLLDLVGKNVDPSKDSELRSGVTESIQAVTDQLKSIQEGSDLPLDERIDNAELVDLEYEGLETLNVRILLIARSGAQILTNLP